MNRQQKQVMDSLVRARSFLDAHPATGTLSYASAREMLEDVVQRTRGYAGAQVSGRDLSRVGGKRIRSRYPSTGTCASAHQRLELDPMRLVRIRSLPSP